MFKMQNEKKTHKYIFGLVRYISVYFNTIWSMLFYPKKTLTNHFSMDRSPDLMKPGAFLMTNILLTHSVYAIFGYEGPEFPFKVSFLKNIIPSYVNYTFSIASIILGLTIFFLIMKRVMKNKNLDDFLNLVFPVLCYSSVVYLPSIVFEIINTLIFGGDIQNLLLSFLNPASMRITFITCIKLLVYLLIPLMMLVWWLWLVYKGLKCSGYEAKVSPKKVVIFSYGIFLIIQITLLLFTFGIVYGAIFRDIKTIIFEDIEKELTKNPPNYLKAAILAEHIANNEMMPEYARYVSILKETTYTLASPLYRTEDKIIVQALKHLKERDYSTLEIFLSEYLEKVSYNREDLMSQLYIGLINDLEKAKELRNSPNFVNLHGKFVNFMFIFPSSLIRLSP
ncbi:MAG: hypothetical protein A2Y97_13760 [Nitrospirae bacterium RBG_13_39_12]|nr:MAG: hypothetical protein A2Y97_13760 [Nitrospirae bacterium RBG_13_39_12]